MEMQQEWYNSAQQITDQNSYDFISEIYQYSSAVYLIGFLTPLLFNFSE